MRIGQDDIENGKVMFEEWTYEEYIQDFRINYAVTRALEIMGEAAKRLPMEIREKYPEIPWKDMAGMRDRIIHGYDKVDLQIVWDTVKKEIPHLKPLIRQVLKDYIE